MSRTRGYVIAAGTLIASVGVAYLMISTRPDPVRREPAPRIPLAITEPAVAGDGPIPVHGAGTVRPRAQIDVAAEISGRVVWVSPAFQSSGRVRRGQSIFRLDDAVHRHRVERARAGVAIQQVELLKVEEEARIARSQYEWFRRRQGEDEPAANTGPLALWEPQLEAARAAVDRDRAVLAEAELDLARTEVHAPFSGIVRSESLEVGQFVAAGQAVGQLYAADAVEVVVPLSDTDATLIPGLWDLRPGDTDTRVAARVVADYGEASYAWEGYVDRVETALDKQTRTLDVIVRVSDPFSAGMPLEGASADLGADSAQRGDGFRGPPLLVGKFVDVAIRGLTPREYFKIHRSALRPDDEVWAVRAGTRLTIVPVRVLQRSDDDVYVTGALQAAQPLVVGGIRTPTEGMEIRVAAAGDP